ncbi:hypothetical protein P691DRAFT_292504 [Macrolepiota fuliginosa MF-IS2]|uniref:Uncharacterized protein n=1 Tax=Macrolepiota fuliginosa MF-IS2 TaxID=1400762 RepID=A0A9P5X6N1_9AGAR|nr:hypothetical protein P691DRAFT_292504 [Macrolepiota fuliginosa MF-IS2]
MRSSSLVAFSRFFHPTWSKLNFLSSFPTEPHRTPPVPSLATTRRHGVVHMRGHTKKTNSAANLTKRTRGQLNRWC